jgi:hypothetical protein
MTGMTSSAASMIGSSKRRAMRSLRSSIRPEFDKRERLPPVATGDTLPSPRPCIPGGREDAERFLAEVEGDDPELAAFLRIEERELEAGGLN